MVTSDKTRGGKKPRYVIPDIAGEELTSQDQSTRRVVNFLIGGEAADDGGTYPRAHHEASPSVQVAGHEVQEDDDLAGGADATVHALDESPGARQASKLDRFFTRPAGESVPVRRSSSDDSDPAFESPASVSPSSNNSLFGSQAVGSRVLSPDSLREPVVEDRVSAPPLVQETANVRPDTNQLAHPPVPAVAKPIAPHAPKSKGIFAQGKSKASPASRQPAPVVGRSPVVAGTLGGSFAIFKHRYGQFLPESSLRLCKIIYDNTISGGLTEYFTTTTDLTAQLQVLKRQCYNILQRLEQQGFIERRPVEKNGRLLGIVLRLNIEPQPK